MEKSGLFFVPFPTTFRRNFPGEVIQGLAVPVMKANIGK
jgi:hypothetical protein